MYTSSASFKLHNQLARCHMKLPGYGTAETTAMHEVVARNVLHQQITGNRMIRVHLRILLFYGSDDLDRSAVLSAVLHCALLCIYLI